MKNFKKFAALAILFALVGCGGGVKSTGNNASTNSTNSGTNISTNSTNSSDKNSTNSTNSGNNSSTNNGNSSSNNGSSSGPSVDVDAEFLASAAKKLVYSGLNTAGVSEDFNLITSLEEGLVTITYKSSNTTYMTIDGNVAKISAPSIGATEEGYVVVTLTATLAYKDKTVEKTFNVKINESRGKVEEGEMVTNPVADTPYKLALTQENKGVDLYFKGEMSEFYYATTENAAEAKDVVLVETDGGFYLTMDANGTTKYLNLVIEMGTDGKEHNNVRIDDTAITVWTFNTEYNTLVTELADGNTYYLGTYNTYSTISASTIDKAATSFVSHLYTGAIPSTPDTPTPDTPVTPGENLTLPFEAKINGSLPSTLTFISQYAAEFYANGGVKVTKIDQGVLTAKFDAADNVKVTVNILKLNPNTKSESSDTTDAFTVYGLNEAGEVVATASFNDVVVGDNTVTLAGEGIVQVKVVMTDYYYDGSVCYNISLGGIAVAQA